MLKRRDVIKLGAVTGAVVALPLEKVAATVFGPSWSAAAFSRPLPVPTPMRPSRLRLDRDVYDLTVDKSTAEIVPGVRTPILSYNGTFPGPMIVARRNRLVQVNVHNRLAADTAVHLHGGNTPQASDGHPLDVIKPGASRTYLYPNRQPAATLWYHDHAHHMEAEQVYRGLSGLYIVEDAVSRFRLPSGKHDIPLMFRDVNLGADGTMTWELFGQPNRSTVLVNGVAQPHLTVQRRRYRLRLLNCSNERAMRFTLGNGASFLQVASDGGFLPRPVSRTEIVLWPAERAEVVVDFAPFKAGTQIMLENADGEVDTAKQLLRFDIADSRADGFPNDAALLGADTSYVPATLVPAPADRKPTVTRKVVLSFDAANGVFLINGKQFDPDRVDFTVKRGSTELWEITNTDTQFQIPHSLHLHLIQFKVLDRDGVRVPEWETYPKDTVRVPPGSTVRILATFDSEYTGVYPFHCHFVDHSSVAMMAQMRIVP